MSFITVFNVQGEVVLDMIDEENLADRKVRLFFQSVPIRSNPNQSVSSIQICYVEFSLFLYFHTIQVKCFSWFSAKGYPLRSQS
jgi:hypothetical protein